MAPTYLLLRPTHEVWHYWHYCVHFHHSSVLTQSVCRFCDKDHACLVILLEQVSAAASLILLIVVVDIVHLWMRWWWWQLLLLWLLRLLSNRITRLRWLHLGVCACKLSRRRLKLLLLYWLPRRSWCESISLSRSAHPAALTSGMPSWSLSRPSVKSTGLIQHALIVPI